MSAGAFFDVVAQMPKSENIATCRAPESSIARMSRRSATPVDLNASTMRPLCRKRLTIAHAAAVLPEFMQVPAIATIGTPCVSSGTSRLSGSVETRAGTPTRCAEIREVEHAAEHAAVERLAVRRIDRVADADHAAEVQQLHDVAGLQLGRQVARVAEQRLAVPERADDDVAALHLGHAAARELERVVARLVVEHLDGDQHAFLARNLGAHADLLAEIRR